MQSHNAIHPHIAGQGVVIDAVSVVGVTMPFKRYARGCRRVGDVPLKLGHQVAVAPNLEAVVRIDRHGLVVFGPTNKVKLVVGMCRNHNL